MFPLEKRPPSPNRGGRSTSLPAMRSARSYSSSAAVPGATLVAAAREDPVALAHLQVVVALHEDEPVANGVHTVHAVDVAVVTEVGHVAYVVAVGESVGDIQDRDQVPTLDQIDLRRDYLSRGPTA